MKFNLIKIILVFVIVSFFSCSPDSKSDDPATTASSSLFMSGKFNGVQMNAMKPSFFPEQTSVVYDASYDTNENRFLWLQGNGLDGLQLNIYIPESQWAVGTYNLVDHDVYTTPPTSNAWLVQNLAAVSSTDITSGTIVITEFNLKTKKIKGTFSFQYNNVMKSGGSNEGPYQVTNGTFDYNLDDNYFQ